MAKVSHSARRCPRCKGREVRRFHRKYTWEFIIAKLGIFPLPLPKLLLSFLCAQIKITSGPPHFRPSQLVSGSIGSVSVKD